MFKRVLIANRGAIACRVIRTLRRLGVESVAVYSDADRHSLHVAAADRAVRIGEPPAARSYLDVERILAAARETGAEAIHPGYGFLAENDGFAERCERDGLVFVGPTPEQMRAFGLKHTARRLAAENDVPLLPGSALLDTAEDALAAARAIGYPVMLKSTAGGGGIGMQLCRNEQALREAFEPVRRLSRNNFADDGVFVEKFVEHARHIEVQIFGDGRGDVIALGERDCSLQRRNQKVVEETPAPNLPTSVRDAMLATAERLARAVSYRSAGTVEYLYDADRAAFYFLEVNTRLQVEHGVTEEVLGVDLVEWMLRVAAGEPLDPAALRVRPRGHSIQVRLYAEDPGRQFEPCTGVLTEVRFPATARVETWVERGSEISPWYDPMIAKLIVHGDDRSAALAQLARALADTRLAGLETNLDYLRQIAADPVLAAGRQTTAYLATVDYRVDAIDVLAGGMQTTLQDWPGRVGYWDIGVPPSGPMDELSFRLGNRLLGNPASAAGLELTVTGPTLRFRSDATVALTGAPMRAELDGLAVAAWAAIDVRRGQTLALGKIDGAGARAYLLVRGGFDAPQYLGSRATFTLGRFGGHGGRQLRTGDVLHLELEPAGEAGNDRPEADPALRASLGVARGIRAARRAGLLHAARHRDVVRDSLDRALQLEPHRRAADRAQARMGARGRRRGRVAPVEHPRQRVCDRHGGLHGRHAGDLGAGRPESGRLRLPGDRDRRGPLEARPAHGRRHRELRARRRGSREPLGCRPRASSLPRCVHSTAQPCRRWARAVHRLRGSAPRYWPRAARPIIRSV